MHDRNTPGGRKKLFFKPYLYTTVKPFRPIVEYYIMDIHILMVMCTPNSVYNSLDVRYSVFSYNYKFRERDDVGACCNICLGADIMHFWDESCKL